MEAQHLDEEPTSGWGQWWFLNIWVRNQHLGEEPNIRMRNQHLGGWMVVGPQPLNGESSIWVRTVVVPQHMCENPNIWVRNQHLGEDGGVGQGPHVGVDMQHLDEDPNIWVVTPRWR